MNYRAFKFFRIFKSVYIFFVIAFFLQFTFAAYDCNRVWNALQSGEAPSPMGLLCPIARIFNIFVLSVAVVFLIMIAYGAIKGSMALGDVKAVISAKNTWTHAIIGLAIVIGFFAIYVILANVLGIGVLSPDDIRQRIEDGILSLLRTGQIQNY